MILIFLEPVDFAGVSMVLSDNADRIDVLLLAHTLSRFVLNSAVVLSVPHPFLFIKYAALSTAVRSRRVCPGQVVYFKSRRVCYFTARLAATRTT